MADVDILFPAVPPITYKLCLMLVTPASSLTQGCSKPKHTGLCHQKHVLKV